MRTKKKTVWYLYVVCSLYTQIMFIFFIFYCSRFILISLPCTTFYLLIKFNDVMNILNISMQVCRSLMHIKRNPVIRQKFSEQSTIFLGRCSSTNQIFTSIVHCILFIFIILIYIYYTYRIHAYYTLLIKLIRTCSFNGIQSNQFLSSTNKTEIRTSSSSLHIYICIVILVVILQYMCVFV